VTAALGYTTGRTYLPLESGGGGATWATFFAQPTFLYSGRNPGNPQLGFRSGPPDIYYQAWETFQDADRFTGSLQVANRPASWLDHRVILGIDRIIEDNQEQVPRNDPLALRYPSFSTSGGTTQGSLTVLTRNANNITADYAANARYPLGAGWSGVTSAGGQFYGRRTRLRDASTTGFPAAGILALSAGTIQRLDRDDVLDNNTLGGFVQQQLIWNDRLFLTGAVRRDDNSAFGTDYPAVTYPKLSASYVLSEEPALPSPGRSTRCACARVRRQRPAARRRRRHPHLQTRGGRLPLRRSRLATRSSAPETGVRDGSAASTPACSRTGRPSR
jgi:hypothetical protein